MTDDPRTEARRRIAAAIKTESHALRSHDPDDLADAVLDLFGICEEWEVEGKGWTMPADDEGHARWMAAQSSGDRAVRLLVLRLELPVVPEEPQP